MMVLEVGMLVREEKLLPMQWKISMYNLIKMTSLKRNFSIIILILAL